LASKTLAARGVNLAAKTMIAVNFVKVQSFFSAGSQLRPE
jgi:hypothetical protein